MNPIKFGTDGWRAVIGEDFIPENIEKVIQAFCDWQKNQPNRQILLGFDRRMQGVETAQLVAEVLAGNGFEVKLAKQFCPTPCISWLTKNTNALAGIMVTASHNPSQWNGIKFKESYGGSASPEYTAQVESQLIQNEKDKRKIEKISLQKGLESKKISYFDPHGDYVAQLRSLVDVEKIRKANFKILNDPLFGAGQGFISSVLGMPIGEIHAENDPKFGGLNPEPIDKNLGALMKKVVQEKWDVGLSTDGDADRIGAVDENGQFVNSHQIFALLLKHYVENKGLKGTIVKSISTSQMITALASRYHLPLIETPIGFKHICKILVEKNALMGGEESGGISFAPHVHERDGVLNGLFLLELMSVTGKRLGQLISELFSEIGTFYFNRVDMHVELDQIKRLTESLASERPSTLAGMKIVSVNTIDGFKFSFDDGSWLLIRASGTEPLVRVYAESKALKTVSDLLVEGEKLVRKS
jgi:alpha-D-glucose phosphate-specific phosphoglucomutase